MTTLKYQERFKTLEGVFDENTFRNLFELESRNVFEELLSPLKIGKESNVFTAKKGTKDIIVKIYRVQNCDFKRMYHYIRTDPRYLYLNNHRRQIIFAWTQREYQNLHKAQKAGVHCPKPLTVRENILVEEMIGAPALPLKDTPPKNPRKFLQEILVEVQKLYQGGMVHGDLSAFNILNWDEKPYLIDFSQSTLTKTPNSVEMLKRDLTNIAQYFKKLGIKANPEEMFLKVTSQQS